MNTLTFRFVTLPRIQRILLTLLLLLAIAPPSLLAAEGPLTSKNDAPAASQDLTIEKAAVEYHAELDLLVFEQQVAGTAGATLPEPNGALDGAPVLGYVFPTTLKPEDVGFAPVEGIVALAATSHPDFDDTPLWDENGDRDYANDGIVFHTHWVVLQPDSRAPGGLAVAQLPASEIGEALPPTNPGMPMYLDSPGFSVVLRGNTLRVLVPAARVAGRTDFRFDAVTAYMEVSTDPQRPMLAVYQVYSVLSKELTLPYEVKRRQER